ncbi:uncharacterized protein SCHCODRAFT_02034177, partial [Schizophyllum commune H4-8]|uniref:uncharacterized protein n=1 Tax=Schizophyllum commune (strain H4-8 / FGSC 9210) TaxID=578458 RepID=UPI002160D5D5
RSASIAIAPRSSNNGVLVLGRTSIHPPRLERAAQEDPTETPHSAFSTSRRDLRLRYLSPITPSTHDGFRRTVEARVCQREETKTR